MTETPQGSASTLSIENNSLNQTGLDEQNDPRKAELESLPRKQLIQRHKELYEIQQQRESERNSLLEEENSLKTLLNKE